MKNTSGGLFSIYTLSGKQIAREKLTAEETTLNLNNNGILFYRFENSDGQVQAGKVMVK